MNSLELRNGEWISCDLLENAINLYNKDSKNDKQRWGEKNKQNSTLDRESVAFWHSQSPMLVQS